MNVQALSRTIIDKIFAVCDYYMLGKPTRNSRHLYDIYKLKDHVSLDENFKSLFEDVRKHRAKIDAGVTPSSRIAVDLYKIAENLIKEEFYANDYAASTLKLISDDVSYETVITCYLELMESILR